MRRSYCLVLPMLVIAFHSVSAADAQTLIADLSAAETRAQAIEGLLKLGAAAEPDLRRATTSGKLDEAQAQLVRRLLGNILVNASPLKPVDSSTLAPYGEDKQKKISGDPSILIDPDLQRRAKNRLLVLSGKFVLEDGPLEYLVVSNNPGAKLHETVLAVNAKAIDVLYSLLACDYTTIQGLDEKSLVDFQQSSGALLSVEFEWETPNAGMVDQAQKSQGAKRLVRVPVQYFAQNLQTQKPMKCAPLVFTGSHLETDPATRKSYLVASREGSLVAVRTDFDAVLNSPLNTRSANPYQQNGYATNAELIPKKGTPCRLIIEPYAGRRLVEADLTDSGAR